MDRQTVQERTEKQVAWLVTLAGARYEGQMQPLTGPALILFTDPVTQSTMGLREPEVTVGNVWRKCQEKRAQFLAAMQKDK